MDDGLAGRFLFNILYYFGASVQRSKESAGKMRMRRMAVVNPKSGHEPRIQRPFRWLLADDGRWMGHSAGRIFYERKIRFVLESRRSLLLVYR